MVCHARLSMSSCLCMLAYLPMQPCPLNAAMSSNVVTTFSAGIHFNAVAFFQSRHALPCAMLFNQGNACTPFDACMPFHVRICLSVLCCLSMPACLTMPHVNFLLPCLSLPAYAFPCLSTPQYLSMMACPLAMLCLPMPS